MRPKTTKPPTILPTTAPVLTPPDDRGAVDVGVASAIVLVFEGVS
jgi:hypothetical protein